jgi:hypothetical protein
VRSLVPRVRAPCVHRPCSNLFATPIFPLLLAYIRLPVFFATAVETLESIVSRRISVRSAETAGVLMAQLLQLQPLFAQSVASTHLCHTRAAVV